jgi:ribosome recycling factor
LKEAACLEEVVKRIIEIDEQAESYRLKCIKAREAEEGELQAEISRIRTEFEESLSVEKKRILEDTMRAAEEEIRVTAAGREETLRRMQANYDSKKDALVEALFGELIEKMKEG